MLSRRLLGSRTGASVLRALLAPSASSAAFRPSFRFFHPSAPALQTAAAAAAPTPSPSSDVDSNTATTSATHLDNFEISAPIKAALRQNFKIESLFPVQAECYNPIVEGKDLIGRSKTGSGKTLAFVLPVVQRLKQFPPLARSSTPQYGGHVIGSKCRVLILEPTRELANQVNQEILKLAHVRTAVLYGGAPAWQQMNALSRSPDLVVATPGRLLDMVRRGVLSLDEVRTVVLDEADEMLRMGFQEQVEEVMSFIQHQKQVLLFSATLPDWVQKTANRYLREPVVVDKVTGQENTTPSTITHKAMVVSPSLPETVELIRDVLEANDVQKSIVFTKTKRDASAVSMLLNQARMRASELHGDVPQMQRDRTMAAFKQGRLDVLVATDVAARGIDISNVDMVINLGFPMDPAFYVHRSGRTGRAGKSGVSLLLYHANERNKLHALTKEIGAPFQQLQIPAEHNGKRYPSRSLLTSRIGYATIQMRGRVDAMDVENELRELTNTPTLTLGRIEFSDGYSFTDIPAEAAAALPQADSEVPTRISLAKELPQEMFGGARVNWDEMRGGGRGGRGGKFGGGGRGGRGGKFGGQQGGGRGGFRSGGDRDGGRFGGEREGRYGGDRGGRYGGGDRGGRYGGADRFPRGGGGGAYGGQQGEF